MEKRDYWFKLVNLSLLLPQYETLVLMLTCFFFFFLSLDGKLDPLAGVVQLSGRWCCSLPVRTMGHRGQQWPDTRPIPLHSEDEKNYVCGPHCWLCKIAGTKLSIEAGRNICGKKRKMNIFSMVVTFENLHEVRRLCHWGPIIALSVISICSTMAILDSIIWYWPLDTTGGSINFIMLINWTVLILYNYFNAMFVGPGYIPLGWKPVSSFVRMNVWRTIYLKRSYRMYVTWYFWPVCLLWIRGVNIIYSTFSTAKCAKDTKPPDPTIVANVTGMVPVLPAYVNLQHRHTNVTYDSFGRTDVGKNEWMNII